MLGVFSGVGKLVQIRAQVLIPVTWTSISLTIVSFFTILFDKFVEKGYPY